MALARRNSAGPQADACDLCHNIDFDIGHECLPEKDVVEIMHRPCTDCLAFEDQSQQLCSTCQHWRFRHLFNCLLNSETHQDRQGKGCWIEFWGEYKPSKGCAVCGLFYHASKGGAGYLEGLKRRKPTDTYELPRIVSNGTLGSMQFHGFDDAFVISTPVGAPGCVQKEIQWSLIASWLEECTKTHNKCHGEHFEQPDEIRLIDVQRRKLVRPTERSKFVALSYVWGTNQIPGRLTCLTSNSDELEQDGALKAERLPKTIQDAFQVCKNLGERYLWVDRLCIVQDDSSRKHDQIEAMAKIFSSASLVIVVLDGDMEAGIPGIRPRLSELQNREEIAGLVYMNALPEAEKLIRNSNWNTRGWTYQEAILARRKLYFSSAKAFFQCHTNLKEEDERYKRSKITLEGALIECEWSSNSWERHLSMYTARSLRYQSDIYNAIAGVSNALLPSPASWLYGLPRSHFDQALLWRNNLAQGWRTADKVLLPRWSWSSVRGKIHGYSDRHRVSKQHTLVFSGTTVVWNYQEKHGESSKFVPVRDSRSVAYIRPRGSVPNDQRTYWKDNRRDSAKLLCFGIAWSQGCIEVKWPFPALTERTFQELAADLDQQWQEVDYLERDLVLCPSQELGTPIAESETQLHRGTLKGRAQTSCFALKRNSSSFDSTFSRPFTIIDNNGRPVGIIEEIDEEKAEITIQFEDSCTHQLIALSIGLLQEYGHNRTPFDYISSNDPEPHLWEDMLFFDKYTDEIQEEIDRFCELVGPNGLDISYLDSQGSALEFIPIVHVMLAEWDGPVARRISVGWVFLTRWVKSNPQFKTVYLA